MIGTLLRNTLHLVSAADHPAYAAVVAASGADDWRRTSAPAGPEVEDLRARLLDHARENPRTSEELAAFIEAWVGDHPGAIDPAEVEHQRTYKWRAFLRWSALVRAPADGVWGRKAPAALRAAPRDETTPDAALEEVVRRHLRAFGPAGAEDVAGWLGTRVPPVRETLERLDVEALGDGLYDLPDAPRPDPGTPAPPRLLAAFDSVVLAYAPGRRERILPDAHRDAVYERANLRIRPTFLVDGQVAGTWSSEVKRNQAKVTLHPLERLDRSTRTALAEEAERVARAVHSEAQSHTAAIE